MNGKNHAMLGVMGATIYLKIFKDTITYEEFTSILPIAVVGGLIADVDHAGSTLGHRIPIIPKLLKHRGFTHTIWYIILCVFVFYKLLVIKMGISIDYMYIFGIAMCSHLLGDMLTLAGVKPFKLFNNFDFKICLPIITSDLAMTIFYTLQMIIVIVIIFI